MDLDLVAAPKSLLIKQQSLDLNPCLSQLQYISATIL